MERKKKLPIGIEFFKDFRRDDFYYVDKTGFIRDLVNMRGLVNLFTRPRRFGKSLNMDMLKTFSKSGQTRPILRAWRFPGRGQSARSIWGSTRSSPLR